MRKVVNVLILLLILVLSFWAINLHDPHLLAIRSIETPLLVGLALFTALLTKFSRGKLFNIGVQAVCSGLVLLALLTEYQLQRTKHHALYNSSETQKTINSRLIIGYNDKQEVRRLSSKGIAGIFLSKRNIENITHQELKNFIASLQKERYKLDLPPLIIASDQEGGPVSRLSPLIEKQAPLAELITSSEPEVEAFKYGDKQGKLLAELGVTLNFSPVVDLKPLSAPSALDFNSLIISRAISPLPHEVVSLAGPYIKGLEKNGVSATLKHFPGLAKVPTDTHHFSAELDLDIQTLSSSDWLPFIQLTKQTSAWIMLSHVILSQVDKKHPVSTSKKVIDQVLRNQLGFQGTLVTDDMTMGAIYNRGFCQSMWKSYSTSVNYILIAWDYDKYYKALQCLEDQIERSN